MTTLISTAPARTVTPVAEAPELPEVRRHTGAVRASDVLAAAGAAASAICLTAIIFTQIAPFNGAFGFVLMAHALFLAIYVLLVSFDETGPAVRDRFAAALVQTAAFLMVSLLAVTVAFPFARGSSALKHVNFYLEDLSEVGANTPLTTGGIAHAIIGTLQQITIALLITVPLGLTTAIFLTEVPGRFARLVRTTAEAMTALPSIVAGLFIYSALIVTRVIPTSGFAAALAISTMMLPIIIRAADVVIRLVSGSLKEASLALGAGQWRTVWHVVLPTARSGLATAIILGAARGLGETSPVLLTAGGSDTFNYNAFGGQQTSLPLVAYKLISQPSETLKTRGFGAAAVLMFIVLVLFIAARTLGGRAPGDLTKAQEHRRVIASRRDADRFRERAHARGAGQLRSPVKQEHVVVLPEQPASQ